MAKNHMNKSRMQATKTTGDDNANKMTRSEAGHKGGTAHHSCRGRECSTKHEKDASKGASQKSDCSWY